MVKQAAIMRCSAESFTLMEMLVVLVVIGILSAIVLPSMVGLFTAGSDAQAYNVLAGQLVAARGLAIQHRTHAGVHAQLADPTGAFTGRIPTACFTAIVWEVLKDPTDPNQGTHFVLAEGFSPQKLPGQMAFGRVEPPFYDPSVESYEPNQLTGDARWRFTSLTFVFASNGQLVDGKTVVFPNDDPNHPAFDASQKDTSRAYLWDPNVANDDDPCCNTSVNAAVMFDWGKFISFTSEDDRKLYLEKYGQIIAVNRYTGTLLGEAAP
ncbi:MAG: prepilin-type N-terminal cleavage/methylation domain-containing protein [Phycisphaerae bacterium]|nr:prepilin-type N-terminal cleavage/methylation domain-containing protein [Phycisphaerae bacterium]